MLSTTQQFVRVFIDCVASRIPALELGLVSSFLGSSNQRHLLRQNNCEDRRGRSQVSIGA